MISDSVLFLRLVLVIGFRVSLFKQTFRAQGIKLRRAFGWRGVRSLFYLICGKNLSPNGLSKDSLSVLVMSLLCAGPDSTCSSHHFCPPAQWGGGLLWNCCGFGTVVQMGRTLLLLPSLWASLALLRDENSHPTGSPFNTPKTGAAGLHASICIQFMLLNLKYKGEGSRQEQNPSSWRM